MIRYIIGNLAWIGESQIVVETQGIGYEIHVPMSVVDGLGHVGQEVKVHTYFHVREDVMQLFGFLTKDDLEVFKLLITVNGIGPKGGLGILSTMTAEDLRFAVLSDDSKSISRAPGIGAKTASKLILELKDKLKLKDVIEESLSLGEINARTQEEGPGNGGYKTLMKEAVEALSALGYGPAEALKAVRLVEPEEDMTVEKLLKLSLKNM